MARFDAADGARPEADRRATGQLPVGLGHERGGALVAGRDDPDPGAVERVEQPEERFAGDGERVADAGGAERVGDEATDGSRPDRDDRLELGLVGRVAGSGSRRRATRFGGLGSGSRCGLGVSVVGLERCGFEDRARRPGVGLGSGLRHRVASADMSVRECGRRARSWRLCSFDRCEPREGNGQR